MPTIPDPFAVLGVPARFDLDLDVVQRAYLAKAAAAHPDALAGVDESQAAVQSAAINLAKSTLDDPERRANALLGVLGGPSKESNKSLPDGFLMDILETLEAIESAVRSGRVEERERWRAWAETQRAGYIAKVRNEFSALPAHPSPKALEAIRTVLNAWRYVERLIEQLDPNYDPARADFK